MKTILYYIIGFLLLLSCSKKENYQTVKIDFCNAELSIPKTFKKSTLNKLKMFLLTSNLPNNYVLSEVSKIENMKAIGVNATIFVDSTNWINNIFFMEGEYVRLNKNLSQQYLGILENEIIKETLKSGIRFERIESKYIGGRNSQLVKIKFNVQYFEHQKFFTQYIISSKTQTLSILVNNLKIDLEEEIKQIKIK